MENSIWVNSAFSILRSTLRITDYIRICVQNGFTWAAMTDIGSTRGLYKFVNACHQNKLKAICGLEIETPEYTLLLIAHNNIGIKRIFTIISTAEFSNSFSVNSASAYHIDSADNHPDLTAFILTETSKLSSATKANLLSAFQNIFFNKIDQNTIKNSFRRVNSNSGSRAELKAQTILTAIRTKQGGSIQLDESIEPKTDVCNKHSSTFYNEQFNLEKFVKQLTDISLEPWFHKYNSVENTKAQLQIEKYAIRGLEQRLNIVEKNMHSTYYSQLSKELVVINNLRMADYIMTVHDYCKYIRSVGILMGPGRGSSVGSLVCYSLYITHIDPIIAKLWFERFLCPKQAKLPDIDVDISSVHRHKIINYIMQKYTSNSASQICTISKMNSKTALKLLIGTINQKFVPSEIQSLISELFSIENIGWQRYHNIENQGYCAPKDLIRSSRFRELKSPARPYNKFWTFIEEQLPIITGLPRSISVHAAGMIISPENLVNVIGLQRNQSGQQITQFAMDDLEQLHYPKFDLLGLHTLTIIDCCLQKIHKYQHKVIKIYQIGRACETIIKQILLAACANDTFGLFQLESDNMSRLFRSFRPTTINELAILISLYRPGVSKIRSKLLKRRQRCEHANLHDYDEIAIDTYGFFIYQEQISALIKRSLGISAASAEYLSRALRSNKITTNEKKDMFIKIGIKNSKDKAEITKLFDQVSGFAKYAFNKSHAVAYAHITYWTVYLKYKYPFEFGSVIAEYFGYDASKVKKIVKMFQSAGFTVFQPRLFTSTNIFVQQNKLIFLPWTTIVGLNKKTTSELAKLTNHKSLDIKEFFRFAFAKFTTDQSQKLIDAGSLDCFKIDRKILTTHLYKIYSWFNIKNNQFPFPLTQFTNMTLEYSKR